MLQHLEARFLFVYCCLIRAILLMLAFTLTRTTTCNAQEIPAWWTWSCQKVEWRMMGTSHSQYLQSLLRSRRGGSSKQFLSRRRNILQMVI